MDNIPHLSKEDLYQQIKARNVIKRDAAILLIANILCFIALLENLFVTPNKLPPLLSLFLFFLLIFIIRTIAVWRQWSVLLEFGLKCPSCHKPLAEKVNWLKSPNHNCPYCGQVALASIKYLKDAEKEIKS